MEEDSPICANVRKTDYSEGRGVCKSPEVSSNMFRRKERGAQVSHLEIEGVLGARFAMCTLQNPSLTEGRVVKCPDSTS